MAWDLLKIISLGYVLFGLSGQFQRASTLRVPIWERGRALLGTLNTLELITDRPLETNLEEIRAG